MAAKFHSVTIDGDMLHGQTGQRPCGYSVVFFIHMHEIFFIILHAAKLFTLVVGVLSRNKAGSSHGLKI